MMRVFAITFARISLRIPFLRLPLSNQRVENVPHHSPTALSFRPFFVPSGLVRIGSIKLKDGGSFATGRVIEIFVPRPFFLRSDCEFLLPGPMLGWLLISNLPPSRATRSLMPERPNESFRASASSTLNPTPLSSTASLTHPSAELTEMFTLVAPECFAILLQHSCTNL